MADPHPVLVPAAGAPLPMEEGDECSYKIAQDMPLSFAHSHNNFKPSGSVLSSCFSTQDLRYFDMEKEEWRADSSSPSASESYMSGLESETSSSEVKLEDAKHHQCSSLKSVGHWSGFFKSWKRKSIKRLPTFPPILPSISRKSRSTRDMPVSLNYPGVPDFYYFKSSWKNFSFSELQNATKNFSCERMIGKGGYAEVYKGCLQDGQLVAIKKLTRGTQEEMISNFLSEIGTIAHVDHPNTAKLIGYGVEGGMHLVIQLSPRGSLASHLHGSGERLHWNTRYKIALGTADGLMYLHENCQRRIIHRDIKADNILLTEDYDPQICDFGLAKWLPKQWTHRSVSKFEGTFGYFAPEYFMHGVVDEKTDVFSFGVLLLELVTGRRALDQSQQSLVIWAKPLLADYNYEELVDRVLAGNYNMEEMDRVVLTASLCIEHSPILRPRMSQVVELIRKEAYKCTEEYEKRQPIRRTYSEELFDADEYNSTRALGRLNRHKEVASCY